MWGFNGHLSRYITPDRGLGYALGIIGGSMMMVLLMYPARKRAAWLKIFGGVGGWFRAHMTLGVVGPLLVLFHANFSLGATNSNVALCLHAAGFGQRPDRPLHLHPRVRWLGHAHATSLEELQATAELLRKQTTTVTLLPNFLTRHRVRGAALVPARQGRAVGALLYPVTIGLRSVLARWRLEQPDPPHGARGGAPVARRWPRTARG